MTDSRIIGALIGLVRACGNNPKTENTDAVVLRALALAAIGETPQTALEEIYAEKNLVSPGCAQCLNPCGNTSDYDIAQLDAAPEDIRAVKLAMLADVQTVALDIYRRRSIIILSAEEMDLIYQALAFISYDLPVDILRSTREKTLALRQKLE